MTSFMSTTSWKKAEQWLDQLDAWIQIESEREVSPNTVLGVSVQKWFSNGVAALNECLHPNTVHEFHEAVQSRESNIDDVLRKLIIQDLAWQPDLNSIECISGATIWRMVIGTMAFRTNWYFGDLANRETILTSFLGQWETEQSSQHNAWHKALCEAKPWAMSTTFDWLIERKAPKALHWVISVNEELSINSISRMVHFWLNQDLAPYRKCWKQIERLRPDLASYIDNYLIVHQHIMEEPQDLNMGAAILKSWTNRKERTYIPPELFEELIRA
jgi:hypothetical protein